MTQYKQSRSYVEISGEQMYIRSLLFSSNLVDTLHLSNSVSQFMVMRGVVFSLIVTLRHFAALDADKHQTGRALRALTECISKYAAKEGRSSELDKNINTMFEHQLKEFGNLPISRADGKQGGTLLWEYSKYLASVANKEKDSQDLYAITAIYGELAELAAEAGCKDYAYHITGRNQPQDGNSRKKDVHKKPTGIKKVALHAVLWIVVAITALVALSLILESISMLQFRTVAGQIWQLPVFWLAGSLIILMLAKKLEHRLLNGIPKKVLVGTIVVGTLLGSCLWIYDANDLRLGDQECSLYYYSGSCVPNSYSDIDCSRVEGTARVLHEDEDVYQLDRDGDGVACEPY